MEVAHIDAFRATPCASGASTASASRRSATSSPTAPTARSWRWSARGLLDAVITQNIDMLHRKAGTRELVEVHGSIASCSCPRCGDSVRAGGGARARSRARPDGVPRCERCAAPLKPDVVLFGELLPAAALERARELCEGAELLLCIGSSLEVHPVAGLPLLTHEAGGTRRDPHAGADAARRARERAPARRRGRRARARARGTRRGRVQVSQRARTRPCQLLSPSAGQARERQQVLGCRR